MLEYHHDWWGPKIWGPLQSGEKRDRGPNGISPAWHYYQAPTVNVAVVVPSTVGSLEHHFAGEIWGAAVLVQFTDQTEPPMIRK